MPQAQPETSHFAFFVLRIRQDIGTRRTCAHGEDQGQSGRCGGPEPVGLAEQAALPLVTSFSERMGVLAQNCPVFLLHVTFPIFRNYWDILSFF